MTYLTSDSGAVTVDWVVLTAGLVGLGLAVMAVVSTGVQDVSGDIEGQLESSEIIATSFAPSAAQILGGYSPFHYSASGFTAMKAAYASDNDAALLSNMNLIYSNMQNHQSDGLTIASSGFLRATLDEAAMNLQTYQERGTPYAHEAEVIALMDEFGAFDG